MYKIDMATVHGLKSSDVLNCEQLYGTNKYYFSDNEIKYSYKSVHLSTFMVVSLILLSKS